MATKEVIFDDMTGDQGALPHEFTLDGEVYDIDLVDGNFAKLEKAMEPFMKHARKRGSGKARKMTRTVVAGGQSRADNEAVRDWAKTHGFPDVAPRGRVRNEIREAFDKAHAPGAKEDTAEQGHLKIATG